MFEILLRYPYLYVWVHSDFSGSHSVLALTAEIHWILSTIENFSSLENLEIFDLKDIIKNVPQIPKFSEKFLIIFELTGDRHPGSYRGQPIIVSWSYEMRNRTAKNSWYHLIKLC